MQRLRPMTALVATTCLLSPCLAMADRGIGGISIEALVGGMAEVENDKYKVELGNQKGEIDGATTTWRATSASPRPTTSPWRAAPGRSARVSRS